MKVTCVLRTGWTLAAAALLAGCPALSELAAERVGYSPILPVLALPPAPPPAVPAPRPLRLVDVASWYGSWHHGRPTASGEPYDVTALTAAHRSLPIGSCVEVTHLGNGRRVHVRVNDRGPYVPGRSIDLSQRAAEELAMVDDGLAPVRIRRTSVATCES